MKRFHGSIRSSPREVGMLGLGVPAFLPWAVHISANVLSNPCWLLGLVAAGGFIAIGLRRLQEDELARLALVTAALFVASSIHIPLGAFSVHLILNGLAGILLGLRSLVAIPLAVFLQAWLLGHGDLTTWGVNSCIMSIPACLARPLFTPFLSGRNSGLGESLIALGCVFHPWSWLLTGPALYLARRRPRRTSRIWVGGFIACSVSVALTCLLQATVLAIGGATDFTAVAAFSFMVHAPLALLEGFIGATIIHAFFVVRPGWTRGQESPFSNVSPTIG